MIEILHVKDYYQNGSQPKSFQPSPPPIIQVLKNLKYWTRTIARESRRLVELKHFSAVKMIRGEFFKVPIPVLFPIRLRFVDSRLKTIQFLQQVVVFQDYRQINYLKCFEDLRKIYIFLVAPYYPKQGHCVKGYLSFSSLFYFQLTKNFMNNAVQTYTEILLNFHIAMANILCTFCDTALESKSTKLWLNGPGGLVSVEPSIACDSQVCQIVNNLLATTVCFSMLNFQLLTIKESCFLKKEMVAEVLSSFFLSASCSLQDMCYLVNNSYSVQSVHWTELVVNDICCQYEVVSENSMSH